MELVNIAFDYEQLPDVQREAEHCNWRWRTWPLRGERAKGALNLPAAFWFLASGSQPRVHFKSISAA
jgi:hypothetical protein